MRFMAELAAWGGLSVSSTASSDEDFLGARRAADVHSRTALALAVPFALHSRLGRQFTQALPRCIPASLNLPRLPRIVEIRTPYQVRA